MGALDATFNPANPGKVSFSVIGMIAVHGVDVDDIGRIVVVGTVMSSPDSSHFVVARITATGQMDSGFDPIELDGIRIFQTAGKNANVARSVDAYIRNGQHRILVSGWVRTTMSS
jgi:hypothetical protein